MAEPKILEDDRDEWFYNSLKRYTSLYMFDLEFPVDAMEIIDDTSICVSGIQNYSKQCEVLQLSLPIKLLPKYMEDGLCKDRDFKILSGGYSPNRVTQIKSMPAFSNFLAGIQYGEGGCTIFKLGDSERGVIQADFSLKSEGTSGKSTTLATLGNKICVNATRESADCKNELFVWTLNANDMKSATPEQLIIPTTSPDMGSISKVKFWDENTIMYSSTTGLVSMYDLRDKQPSLMMSPAQVEATSTSVQYSFDCIPALKKVGLVDTNGSYISVDTRSIKASNNQQTRLLPLIPDVNTIIGGKFNLEYDPKCTDSSLGVKFVVTGMKQDIVPVFLEKPNVEDIFPVFTHDGHSKAVTHVCWHTLTEKLLFSASVDSVLHAWQYID